MDNLSEEEKKAINRAKQQLKETTFLTDIGHKDLETILNLIEKQNKEIENIKNLNKHQSKDMTKAVNYTFELNKEIEIKDKMIDEMSKQLAGIAIWNNEKEEPIILMSAEEVNEYFRKKVE